MWIAFGKQGIVVGKTVVVGGMVATLAKACRDVRFLEWRASVVKQRVSAPESVCF